MSASNPSINEAEETGEEEEMGRECECECERMRQRCAWRRVGVRGVECGRRESVRVDREEVRWR